jgi:hypothetical protein
LSLVGNIVNNSFGQISKPDFVSFGAGWNQKDIDKLWASWLISRLRQTDGKMAKCAIPQSTGAIPVLDGPHKGKANGRRHVKTA